MGRPRQTEEDGSPVWQRTLQAAANGSYRSLARLGAKMLRTSPIVRSIFVHRSAATGEVSFARSDIDLLVIVRKPSGSDRDAAELWELCRKASRLRSFVPVFGHFEVHDPEGLVEWHRADTYWASIERRSLRRLHGIDAGPLPMPVRPEHAVLRFCLFPYYFLTAAVRGRNQRNLRKIALDMWNCCLTAMGQITEPFLTRDRTEEFLLANAAGFSAARLRSDAGYALGFLFRAAQQLHSRLLPPLRGIREPVTFEARLPPSFHRVMFVVLPGLGTHFPPGALATDSLIATPELLDLYIHYANLLAYWVLPPDLLRIGFARPGFGSAVRTCRYEFHNYWLRTPGFVNRHSGRPYARMYAFRHILERLESGNPEFSFDPADVDRYQQMRPTVTDYYRCHYARLLDEQAQLWDRLRTVSAHCPGEVPAQPGLDGLG